MHITLYYDTVLSNHAFIVHVKHVLIVTVYMLVCMSIIYIVIIHTHNHVWACETTISLQELILMPKA